MNIEKNHNRGGGINAFLDKKTANNQLKASLLTLLAVSCFGLSQPAEAMECQPKQEIIKWSGAPTAPSTNKTITGKLHGMEVTLTDTSTNTSPRKYTGSLPYPGNAGINPIGQQFLNSGEYLWPSDNSQGATYTFVFNAPTKQTSYLYMTALDRYSKVTFTNGLVIEKLHNATGLGTSVLTADPSAPTNGVGATIKIPKGVNSFSFKRESISQGGDGYFFALSSGVCTVAAVPSTSRWGLLTLLALLTLSATYIYRRRNIATAS